MAPSRKRKRTTSSDQEEPHRAAPPAPLPTAHEDSNSTTQLIALTDSDSTPTSADEAKPAGRCHFFRIPGELRNEIYELVLIDTPVSYLPRQSRTRQVVTTAPLATANKQIRSEFLKMATECGPLTTNVRNYNFGHLITFFNRLDEVELKRLEAGEDGKTAAAREVSIKLVFAGSIDGVHEGQLRRWLTRCENTSKNGSKINFKYTCEQGEDTDEARSSYNPGPWNLKTPPYAASREESRLKRLGGDEAEKMTKAIGEARGKWQESERQRPAQEVALD